MSTIQQFLKEHGISEVEAVVPDMAGVARGKLMPAERKMVSQVEWLGDKTEITLSYNLGRKGGALLLFSRALGERLHNSNLGGGGIP